MIAYSSISSIVSSSEITFPTLNHEYIWLVKRVMQMHGKKKQSQGPKYTYFGGKTLYLLSMGSMEGTKCAGSLRQGKLRSTLACTFIPRYTQDVFFWFTDQTELFKYIVKRKWEVFITEIFNNLNLSKITLLIFLQSDSHLFFLSHFSKHTSDSDPLVLTHHLQWCTLPDSSSCQSKVWVRHLSIDPVLKIDPHFSTCQ